MGCSRWRCTAPPPGELTSSGALEDFTAGGKTDLDRQLAEISSQSQVDDELARMKAEIGSGEKPKELGS